MPRTKKVQQHPLITIIKDNYKPVIIIAVFIVLISIAMLFEPELSETVGNASDASLP